MNDPITVNFTSVMHRHPWLYGHWRIMWATTVPGWAKWCWSPIGVTQFICHGRFNAEKYWEILSRYPLMNRLALRDALSAGEPLNVEPIEVFGVTTRDGYGQTETVSSTRRGILWAIQLYSTVIGTIRS